MDRHEPANDGVVDSLVLLLDLPSELRTNILSHIDDKASLIAVSSTCRCLHEEVQKYLYSTVVLSRGPEAVAIEAAFRARKRKDGKQLSAYIRNLFFEFSAFDYEKDDQLEITPFNEYDFCALNMVSFCGPWKGSEHPLLQKPDPRGQNSPAALATAFWVELTKQVSSLPSILPNLRSCCVDFGQDKYLNPWEFTEIGQLWFSPSLKELVIRNAIINGDVLGSMEKGDSPSTPLSSLQLIECDIDVRGLRQLLSTPRTLTSLKIIYARFLRTSWVRGVVVLGNGRWVDVLAAIDQHHRCLQELEFTEYGTWTTISEIELPLDFSVLTSICQATVDSYIKIECARDGIELTHKPQLTGIF